MAFNAENLRGSHEAEFGDALAVAACTLARRFAHGATLWCVAPEWPEHPRHVAVEFVHPVIVGKRALPAVSVEGSDPATALRTLVRAGDCVLAIGAASSPVIGSVLRRAQAWGATTIWIGAGERPFEDAADHVLWADGDPATVRYDGRLVLRYHVLWELSHVCFEHPGLLVTDPSECGEETCITCADEGRLGDVIENDGAGSAHVRTARGIEVIDTTIVDEVGPGDVVLIHAGSHDRGGAVTERTDFLYPFIEGTEHDAGTLLTDLAASARAKLQTSNELRSMTLSRTESIRDATAAAMADRFERGGRLFVFGNGGSSTDAAALAALFLAPPRGTALPARHLVEDSAVLTALGNDVGFELVFSRQLIAHATECDIAIAISTSGNSANLLTALAEAHRRHMLTIGLAGYSGGAMAESPDVDHCLVVEADSVHRVQETQAALGFALWEAVQAALATVPGGWR